MQDNQLFLNLIAIMKAGLAAQSMGSVAVKQTFQPRNQGANTGPTIYLHKLFDKRLGWSERSDVWDSTSQSIVHTERQYYETTFQVNALSTQDPADINAVTASDLCNIAASVMQSSVTLTSLRALGLGILWIGDVRNPYFTDDRDRQEAAPSFDFTIEHEQVIISTAPVVGEVVFNVDRV